MQLQIARNPNENANGAKKRAVAKGIGVCRLEVECIWLLNVDAVRTEYKQQTKIHPAKPACERYILKPSSMAQSADLIKSLPCGFSLGMQAKRGETFRCFSLLFSWK